MKIIGLTRHVSGNHDSSCALLIDGQIIFAEAEERVSRKKHDNRFPVGALKEALAFSDLQLDQIDYFASAAPDVSFTRLIMAYLSGLGLVGVTGFAKWFINRMIFELKQKPQSPQNGNLPHSILEMGVPGSKLLVFSHDDCHAAAAYFSGPFDKCLCVVIDGYGIEESGMPLAGKVYLGDSGVLRPVESIPLYASIALYYGAVTVALGFQLNDGEGKTMGLAAYGDAQTCYEQMDLFFPDFQNGQWLGKASWLEVNGVSRLDYFKTTATWQFLHKLVQKHQPEQLAAACQKVFEDRIEKYFHYLKEKYSQQDVVASGGVFLNVKSNMNLLHKKIVNNLFVYPNPGDGGTAVGAAFLANQQKTGAMVRSEITSVALGCGFDKREISQTLEVNGDKLIVKKISLKNIAEYTARLLTEGKVVGFFQGRSEWGPRALGHRSVLADPRDGKIKERINSLLKKRDWFMPFAPSVLADRAGDYFVSLKKAPFMTLADSVQKRVVNQIPAVIHIDQTARPQLVNGKDDLLYYETIRAFGQKTGQAVVLNTSFNKHGLPIVHTPQDAVDHLLWGCVDELIIDCFHVRRK